METFKSIFATPVLETNIGVSKKVIDRVHQLDYYRTGDDNADISESMDVLDEELFLPFAEKINFYVEKYCFDFVKFNRDMIQLDRIESWANRHHPQDWCQYHNHANAFITGVWYLEIPKESGDLELFNPKPAFGEPISFECVESNSANHHTYFFKCEPGKLIIFPSIIGHSVTKNRSNGIRTSIAFNYFLRGNVEAEDKTFHT